ncbi:TPA: hypothetical protein HA265_03270 [Candidatus Woesearchaeota archaeon]|nr:hypothetical protein [Candidatus Woesearchaeota archaeon]
MLSRQEDTLVDLGLSRNEARTYLALLDIGSSSATKVADAAGLHRPNVYDSLERLKCKGLVSHCNADSSRLFVANSPDHLKALLEQKSQDLDAILPQLQLMGSMSVRTFAEVHEGIKAWKLAASNLLNYNHTIYSFGIPKSLPVILGPWVQNFHDCRIRKKIPMVHIYNEDAKDRIAHLNSLRFTEASFLPSEFNSPVTTTVCGDEVLISTWDPIMFVRIVNPLLARAYENYCLLLLAQTKKVKTPSRRKPKPI